MNSQKRIVNNLGSIMNFFIVLIFLLFSISESYSKKKNTLGCWEAHTNYNDVKFTENNYILMIRKDSIEISINNIHKYNYKFQKEKDINYLMINEEKMILEEWNSEKKHFIKIKYFYKKSRESVDEITTLVFEKC